MLETYFTKQQTLERLRAEPTGQYMDGFAKALHTEGYGVWAGQSYLRAAGHLGIWIKEQKVPVTELNEGVIAQFGCHLSACHCLNSRNGGVYDDAVIGARHFLDHLRSTGVAPAGMPHEKPPAPAILEEFEAWMRRHRGVTGSTMTVYRRILSELLDTVGESPDCYNASNLRRGVELQTRRSGRSWAKLVITAARMFLRYLAMRGMCDVALADALPILAHWKRASCPAYLSTEDVEKLIKVCDPATAEGSRDRAVVLLLVRLGLRAGDVADLRWGDIDWDSGTLAVTGKGRRQYLLPLSQDAGDAILNYVEHGRPAVRDDHVFLRVNAPFVPLTATSAVSALVNRAARRAGLSAGRIGAHLLRHTAATLMLRQGASLQTIGNILRHQSVDTTAVYAKIDIGMLSEITQPWPVVEVSPC